jgi:hypothetical protein
MSVVRNNISLPAGDPKQNALGRAPLVRWDDVLVSEDLAYRIAETLKTAASCVAFIALHDCGPLLGRHGASAGIRQQIDENIVGGKEEEVVMG